MISGIANPTTPLTKPASKAIKIKAIRLISKNKSKLELTKFLY